EIAKRLHTREGPILIVLGTDRLVEGMENAVKLMKKDEEKEIVLEPEEAFGNRDASHVKVMHLKDFEKSEVNPYPGAVIQMDTPAGVLSGVVKSVNSGRVLVDFNHPLGGQKIKYKLKLTNVIETPEEKINALIKDVNLEGESTFKEGKAILSLKPSKEDKNDAKKKELLEFAIKQTIPEVKQVEFSAK
ncbi:FKBP-type peptidyl-prolyl cis-trans isomerase, partial [Candidatus Micrarchaeota archaeon]|nr:FKBP-type peptidyl-prolyl cis-trans isomerase [Candidatus Micrarchaeota archaeon]